MISFTFMVNFYYFYDFYYIYGDTNVISTLMKNFSQKIKTQVITCSHILLSSRFQKVIELNN